MVSVARRRREVGLLKVLGFVNRPGGLGGVVAGNDVRSRRDRDRRAARLGGRGGGVEGVRVQPRGRAGVGGAGLARVGPGIGVVAVANLLAVARRWLRPVEAGTAAARAVT